MGNYIKAAECLDRAAEVDAYEPGHLKRLESLRGKVDDSRFKVISSRFSSLGQAASEPVKTEEPTLGASALQDLILQAEILVQYGMKSKAMERAAAHPRSFSPRRRTQRRLAAPVSWRLGLFPSMRMIPVRRGRPGGEGRGFPRRRLPPTKPPMSAALPGWRRLRRSCTSKAMPMRYCPRRSTKSARSGKWRAASPPCASPGLPPTAIKESRADGVPAADAKTMAKLVAGAT